MKKTPSLAKKLKSEIRSLKQEHARQLELEKSARRHEEMVNNDLCRELQDVKKRLKMIYGSRVVESDQGQTLQMCAHVDKWAMNESNYPVLTAAIRDLAVSLGRMGYSKQLEGIQKVIEEVGGLKERMLEEELCPLAREIAFKNRDLQVYDPKSHLGPGDILQLMKMTIEAVKGMRKQ